MTSGPARPAQPACSVIVGVRHSEHRPQAGLDALRGQLAPGDEVLVVDDDEGAAYPDWARHHVRPGAMVPELWATGLAHARHDTVVLTSGAMVPQVGWLDRARAVGTGPEAAVGGAIEPGLGLGAVDWAVYFCRYARHMLPLAGGPSSDLAADNAVYRAGVLARYRHLWADSFGEVYVHRAMVADGLELALDPDLVVCFGSSSGAGDFTRQRYRHGRQFGRQRAAGEDRRSIVAAALGTPLVPAVMTARAARHVWARRRHRARFLAVSPLVVWFYGSWALGEAAGRLDALRAS